MVKKPKKRSKLEQLLNDDALITSALRKGVRDALRQHKLAGNPICEWRDGKVVWSRPDRKKKAKKSTRSQ